MVFLEGEDCAVLLLHVLAVDILLPPRLHVGTQPLVPFALHGARRQTDLGKHCLLELPLGELHRTDVEPDLEVQFCAIVVPYVPGLCELVVVCLPDEPLDSLLSELLVLRRISPDGEGSLDLFLDIFALGVPDGEERLVLRTVHVAGALLGVPPLVEVLRQELALGEEGAEVLVLDVHLDRLEGLLVPLLHGDLQLVLAEAVDDLDELPQGAVALLVESAVGEELVEGVLLALREHALEQLEHDLADEELVVVTVVRVHLGPLSRDFCDAVVVSAVQLVEFRHQVVPFGGKSIDDRLNVVILGVVPQAVPLEAVDLCVHRLDSVVAMALLLLELLDHGVLPSQVTLDLIYDGGPPVSFGLQDPEP